VKFLIDAQLPPFVAEWLCKKGHEARHVQDVELHNASDADVRLFAGKNGMVVITKDRDFIPTDQTATQIIWVRTGNIGTRTLIDRIEASLPQLLAHLEEGARLVELR
jgi:predicted nuclease of predicted toxin-antitoxin system